MGRKIQDSILFLGNRDDVARLYQAMDVFVLPSRYEGLPVVAVEAQAAGLPCVLSDRITDEAGIIDNARFISLHEGSHEWAKAILGASADGRGCEGDVSRFEIRCQAEGLADYYVALAHARGRTDTY